EIRADLRRAKRDSALTPVSAVTQQPSSSRRPWSFAVAVAAAAVVLGGAALYFRAPRVAALTDKDTIVLADFTNGTGDPVFDDTLRQGLAVQFAQSPFLSVVSDGRVRTSLQLMGQPTTAHLTHDLARDVCVRTGSTAVVNGSIASLGNE